MVRERKPEPEMFTESAGPGPSGAEPPTAPRPKNTGDSELKAIGRLTRYLNGLPIRARRRVAAYLADRIADDAEEK